MTPDIVYWLLPVLLLLIGINRHMAAQRRRTARAAAVLQEAEAAGLTEPPTLHPVLDLSVCMGSGACARACPEKALGVIDGKAVLVNPSHCIGHGACATACPVGAIRLVFGTARRGVEIPEVRPNFETNVPGIFIAGELGGMGLIRNAIRQGTQAIATIAERPRAQTDLDVLIVGAGPAGIAASLAAQQAGLRYATIEQEDSVGGTTYQYPRNKLVMTEPMRLPMIGEIKVREVSKEELMTIWHRVIEEARPVIRFGERMESITPSENAITVQTNRETYRVSNLLLAIGRRGTPRKLGVPGEELSKVVYRLIEASQYRGLHVMVVGGGDSALEAALDLADEPGTTVTLSYRGKAFDRVKPKNRDRLQVAATGNRLRVELDTQVARIEPDRVHLTRRDAAFAVPNDRVIVCAGGELPTPMLKKIGIHVEAHYGD